MKLSILLVLASVFIYAKNCPAINFNTFYPNNYLEDYSVTTEDSNGVYYIQIAAIYFVQKGDADSKAAAIRGTDFWNQLSGRFVFHPNDKSFSIKRFVIRFRLEVCEMEALSKQVEKSEPDRSKDGANGLYYNTFRVVEGLTFSQAGLTTEITNCNIKSIYKDSTSVAAHEIGHTLGLCDRKNPDHGLMYEYNTGSELVRESDILQIIEYARAAGKNTRVKLGPAIPVGIVVDTKGN